MTQEIYVRNVWIGKGAKKKMEEDMELFIVEEVRKLFHTKVPPYDNSKEYKKLTVEVKVK